MSSNNQPWDKTPKLSKADRERLAPIRANNATLTNYLRSEDVNVEDLKKLIMLEYEIKGFRARGYVTSRLFSRLESELRTVALQCLNANLKKS